MVGFGSLYGRMSTTSPPSLLASNCQYSTRRSNHRRVACRETSTLPLRTRHKSARTRSSMRFSPSYSISEAAALRRHRKTCKPQGVDQNRRDAPGTESPIVSTGSVERIGNHYGNAKRGNCDGKPSKFDEPPASEDVDCEPPRCDVGAQRQSDQELMHVYALAGARDIES